MPAFRWPWCLRADRAHAVRMEETGVPEASSHVPRIADFTGITFTIH